MVKIVRTKAEFNETVAQAGTKPIFIDFFATWCGPCVMISPFFEELSQTHAEQAVFIKIDVDESEELSMQFQVSAMPTFITFQGGQKVDELVGASKDKLQAMVLKHCK
jgi:thioredoxin 1